MGPKEKVEIEIEMGVEAEVEIALCYELTVLMFRLALEGGVQVYEA